MSYLTTGWLCVISGPLFIAIGGFLTTKGWDEFSNHNKRKTLVTSAMRELAQNSKYLNDMDKHFQLLPSLNQVYLLPTFHFSSIQTIKTSPLFKEKDESLLNSAFSYLYNVNPINDSILKLNIIFSDESSSLRHIKGTYSSFYNSKILQRFRKKHEDLQEQLIKLKRGHKDRISR